MKNTKIKLFNILYLIFLFFLTIYIALDTFVIEKTYKKIENNELNEDSN